MAVPVFPSARVTLVGAGPGDPELLTVKGLRAIQSADIILYDALVDEELLAYAPAGIPLRYVGKRCGQQSMKQDQINKLLVRSAQQYGHVVRLKGGDSFIFGRGGEEYLAAQQSGIPVRVIPGVSSALAVPALSGIPLTHRGLSRGFWVLTATTQEHQFPQEMHLAAQSQSTVVILMGTRKIEAITALFKKYRRPDVPIALLQSGSRSDNQTTIGSLSQVGPLMQAVKKNVPGIIVIGAVVDILNITNQQDMAPATVKILAS